MDRQSVSLALNALVPSDDRLSFEAKLSDNMKLRIAAFGEIVLPVERRPNRRVRYIRRSLRMPGDPDTGYPELVKKPRLQQSHRVGKVSHLRPGPADQKYLLDVGAISEFPQRVFDEGSAGQAACGE